jgi:hypothetical protein
MQWDMITGAAKRADSYLLTMSRGQFLLFPFTVFNSESDMRLLERILKQKNLLTEEKTK